MNKFEHTGRVISASYTPPVQDKKSRAVIKAVIGRKGRETEFDYVAFSPVAEFIGRRLGVLPTDKGEYIQGNARCFLPGCRVEVTGYAGNTPYVDTKGVKRSSYEFILEEAVSEPLDAEGWNWYSTYISKQQSGAPATQQTQASTQQYIPTQKQVRQPVAQQPQAQQMYAPTPQQSFVNQHAGNGTYSQQTPVSAGYPQTAGQTQATVASGNAAFPADNVQPAQLASQAKAPVPNGYRGVQTQRQPQQGGFRAGTAPQQSVPGVPAGGFRPASVPQQVAKPGGVTQIPMPT